MGQGSGVGPQAAVGVDDVGAALDEVFAGHVVESPTSATNPDSLSGVVKRFRDVAETAKLVGKAVAWIRSFDRSVVMECQDANRILTNIVTSLDPMNSWRVQTFARGQALTMLEVSQGGVDTASVLT